MSLNPNTRTETIEVLVNPAERSGLSALCGVLGIPMSTLVRSFINKEVRLHGMGPPPSRESRGCRGPGRPANRASGGMLTRRQV